MTYRFRDMGPYEFSVRRTQRGKRFIDPIECRNAVFDQASGDAARIGIDDIYSAVDLYVMGLRTRCEWPYYVGQSARPLYRRVFEGTDKPTVYGSIIDEMPRSRPFIYLLPMVSTSGAQVQIFGKGKIWTAPKKVINHAEQALISQALHINPNLYNTMPRMAIERYLIDGTPAADLRETLDAKAFRSLLGHDVSTARSNAIEEIMQASERAVEAEGGYSTAQRDQSGRIRHRHRAGRRGVTPRGRTARQDGR